MPLHATKELKPDELPIGADGKEVDMRLFPAQRIAAREIGEKLRGLNPGFLKYSMLAAVSGSGKTSVAFQLAMEFYTIYFVCTPSTENARASRFDPSTFPFWKRRPKDASFMRGRSENGPMKLEGLRQFC